jgi:hypothetical protein
MLARQFVIGLGIALIFPMLVYFGFAAITPPPKNTNFFHVQMTPRATPEERAAYQTERRNETRQWQLAQAQYAKKLIVVMVPLGIAAAIGGYFLGVNAIGTGLLIGGLIAVVFGYAGYWAFLTPLSRFLSLLAGFVVLLFIGIKHTGLTWNNLRQGASNGPSAS